MVDSYLQEMKNLVKLRIRNRAMTSLKNTVSEVVSDLTQKANDDIVQSMKDKGVTEEVEIQHYKNEMVNQVVETYMKEKGPELVGRIPGIVVAEAGKISDELVELMKDAAGEAMQEIIEELTGKPI